GLGGVVVGFALAFGLCSLVYSVFLRYSPFLFHFSIFVTLVSVFHLLEFCMTALFHEVRFSSWIIDHSAHYKMAMAAACAEFWIERMLFPEWKHSWSALLIALAGLVVMVAGQALRTVSMWQGRESFTHLVQSQARPEHKLVKSGVFAHIRHPSYLGWFAWSIASQVLLFNPLCVVAFAFASWQFFAMRIPDEELKLINMFGEEYVRYRAETPTCIPLMDGHVDAELQELMPRKKMQ
ncbi:MAG: hypothetical protein MHM6MM_003952, partial [Cercozoa sp. M6MM]